MFLYRGFGTRVFLSKLQPEGARVVQGVVDARDLNLFGFSQGTWPQAANPPKTPHYNLLSRIPPAINNDKSP